MATVTGAQQEMTHALAATLRRMRPTLLRNLASLAVIDRRHVTCALTTAEGQVVGIDTPARLGIVRAVARSVLDYFSDNLTEGDVILTNDPFSGGTHIQDVTLLKPLFAGDRLVSWAVVQVPVPDLGGMALGGYYPFALEVWAEGVRVTPTKLYRQGVLQRDVLTMLTLNSRLPHLIEKDLDVMLVVLDRCQTEVATLVSKHTPAGYCHALSESIGETTTQIHTALTTLPHGEWSGESLPVHCCLEDTQFRVKVRVAFTPDTVVLDFSGSSAAAKGFVNSTAATTMAAAATPFLSLWPSLLVNEGIFQCLTFTIPDKSFLHATLPMSVGWSPYQPSQAVIQAVTAALQQAQCVLPPENQSEAWVTAPPLPFTITGCGRSGCPFPTQPE